MSIFAVQVHTGYELIVKRLLLDKIKLTKNGIIESIYAFEKNLHSLNGTKTISSFREGYIFIKLNQWFETVPAEIWYFVKKVPHVLRILKFPIPKSEFEKFVLNLDLTDSVEVALNELNEITKLKKYGNLKIDYIIKLYRQIKKRKEKLRHELQKLLSMMVRSKRSDLMSIARKCTIRGDGHMIVTFPITLIRKNHTCIKNRDKWSIICTLLNSLRQRAGVAFAERNIESGDIQT